MKRRGFTLIELMVVIAIIIILAAIAIPNYLTMTARAKKSRVASDFAALATALETYKTDWNQYPAGSTTGIAVTTVATTGVYAELTGTAVTTGLNLATGGNPTAAGDTPPIIYMTTNILASMINPYNNVTAAKYKYLGTATGTHWLLYAGEATGTTEAAPWLWRSDTITTLTENPTTAPAL